MNFLRTRRARLWAAAALIIGLILTFPLSVAFSLLGLKDMGVTARSLRGPVWWGGAEELTVGGIRLGTLNVFLDPLPLFIGRASIDLIRVNGKPDDFLGAIVVGPGTVGVDRVTGSLPLGATLAPLPITRANFEKFSAQFAATRCTAAEGRVRGAGRRADCRPRSRQWPQRRCALRRRRIADPAVQPIGAGKARPAYPRQWRL